MGRCHQSHLDFFDSSDAFGLYFYCARWSRSVLARDCLYSSRLPEPAEDTRHRRPFYGHVCVCLVGGSVSDQGTCWGKISPGTRRLLAGMAEEVTFYRLTGKAKCFTSKMEKKTIFARVAVMFFSLPMCLPDTFSLVSNLHEVFLSMSTFTNQGTQMTASPARDAAFILEAHRRNCDLQVSCYRRVAECVRCLHFLVTLSLSLRYLRRECLTVGKTRLAGDDPSFHFRPCVRPSVRRLPFVGQRNNRPAVVRRSCGPRADCSGNSLSGRWPGRVIR